MSVQTVPAATIADATSAPTKGLTLSVYRDASSTYDCTAGGVTSRVSRLTLVGSYDTVNDTVSGAIKPVTPLPQGARPFAADEETAPAVALVVRSIGGPVLSLVPVRWDAEREAWVIIEGWFMAGGNYAATCDSRFSDLARSLTGKGFYGAVAVHDRQEW